MAPAVSLAAGNAAPTANTDAININEDAGPATGSVLTNDTDRDGDTLSVTGLHLYSLAAGSLSVAANGGYSYTPPQDWSGSGLAWYYVSDGNDHTVIGYINVTVQPVNDAPVAQDHAISTDEDTPLGLTAAQLKAGATDVEGNPISVTGVSGATGGDATWDGAVATFNPDPDACGEGGYDYTVEDSLHATDTAHVTVTVACVDDAPVAAADEAAGTEDHDVVLGGNGLVANDTDVEHDALSVAAVRGATHGDATLDAGDVTFTPDADFCGAAGLEYRATDGSLDSGWATVTIAIACENDAPVAIADEAFVAEDSGAATYDVLANDTDVDHDALTIADFEVDPAAGDVAIVGGEIRYTPASGFKGDAVIAYLLSDGNLTDTGTLTVHVVTDSVAPVEAVPTVTLGTSRVNESAALVIGWSATDAGTGVATYTVQANIGGAGWTAVYTGANTSITRFYPFGKSLAWRVMATDKEGNASDWIVSATRSLHAYQGGSPVTRTGTWTSVASTSCSGTGYLYTTALGRYATFSFTGLGVMYIAPKNTTGGYVKVRIDGTTQRFNLRSSTTSYGVVVASKLWSASGAHTIRVTNDQSGRRASLDAFVVLR
jgi:hypothetical protein